MNFGIGHNIIQIVGWVIVASLIVLVIMNADKFATVIGSSSSALISESALLTGSGYQSAGFGNLKKAA